MRTPRGAKSASAHAPAPPRTPVEPEFPTPPSLPSTLLDLFRALALTVAATVEQPDPKGQRRSRKHTYALPWPGFAGWRDARQRLAAFETAFAGRLAWAPFNDSINNDGPMSLNAYPGRAFIERVTNEGDANLEARAAEDTREAPRSPAEAVERWFQLGPDSLSAGVDREVEKIARETVTVSGWLGDPKDPKDSIFDARDLGIGLTASEMPATILSLNRGNKKAKPWLTGKHGQGASSTYQYSDLTLIASRKRGSRTVAFTFVEATWDAHGGVVIAKTPTYRYLLVDGVIPEVEVPESDFPAGTLVRHIGYTAADLLSTFGENSLYGLLMRSLAKPLFPVWLEIFTLRPTKVGGFPVFAGYRRYGRVIRGTINALERAYAATLGPSAQTEPSETPEIGEDEREADAQDQDSGKILHRASEYYQLPTWDYGARTGVGELGRVKINYWVADPAGRPPQDVLRNWVDPDKTILMTLDGQTHAEESRAIITGQHGAKLWAVGKYMVVQIDCDELDPRAKYEMFTSTREHAKETPVKKMILEELVRRLSFDTKLQELNVKLAAADVKRSSDDDGEAIGELIKKYLKAAGISFDQLTRKVEKWTDVDEAKSAPAVKREPPPIEAKEPPTFVRWRLQGDAAKLYPGQKYSFVFETDAHPSYWNAADQANSKIKVLAHTVRYTGAGDMLGGRVRCHFECPADVAIGSKGFVQVQLDFAVDAAKMHRVPVEIVEKPRPSVRPPKPRPEEKEDGDKGDGRKTIMVKVRKKDWTQVEIPVVRAMPVKRDDPTGLWQTLGWPMDPGRVGFSIRSVSGKVQLYYNAEFPPFLDMRRRMSKKSLEEEFVTRFEMKLILHTIFTLNYDFIDEDEFAEEQKKQVKNLLCATAESLALATKSELEIESKLKSEDSAPIASPVASGLSVTAPPAETLL